MNEWSVPMRYTRSEGAVYDTDPNTGELICKNPGTVTYDTDWPPAALQRIAYLEGQIAELRRQLVPSEKGDGHG